jgi:RNA polymerase sigma-70 factor, ECF subfamily
VGAGRIDPSDGSERDEPLTKGREPTGERVSTEALFRSHAPFVARFLHRFGVGAEELDDAVQEVFLVVHRNGGYLPGPATPTTYLASVAVRAASSYRRRARASRERHAALAPEQAASPAKNPAQIVETRDALRSLQTALDALAPDLKAVLVLVELEGESCTAIATALRIPVGTVYWRLHRARKAFQAAVRALDAGPDEAGSGSERRMEKMALGASLFGKSSSRADALLEAGRKQSPVTYDTASALARHEALVQSGAPLPSWASAASAGAAAGAGAGLTAVAFVCALAATGTIGAGVGWWYAKKTPVPHAATVATSTGTAEASPAGPPPRLGRPAPETWAQSAPSPPASAQPSIRASADEHDRATAGRVARAAAAPHLDRDERALLVAANPTDNGARTESEAQTPTAPTAVAEAMAYLTAPSPVPAAPGSATARGSSDPAPALGTDDMEEMRQVAAAQNLLASDPTRALALVRDGESRFAAGYLREERRYIGIAALFKLGRADEARAEAARFIRDYPGGPFTQRVRAAADRASP